MDNHTPFHENHERPAGFTTPPPPPPPAKAKVPVWAMGLGALLLALLVTLIVVFSTGDDKKEPEAVPAPAVTVTATPTPEPTPTPAQGSGIQDRAPVIMSQSQFLNLVRGESPYLSETPDDEIMAYSDAVCDALDEGQTPEEVLTTIEEGSASKAEGYGKGVVAGLTVQNYCPEYSGDFEKFLDAQGVAVDS